MSDATHAPRTHQNRKSKLRDEGELQNDSSIGSYTRAQLLEMDRKFCAAMEAALAHG
jgi:hypothetical protein